MVTAHRIPERFFLPSSEFKPAYMALHRSGELKARAEAALTRLAECYVCPRDCGVDRLADKTAACKTGRYARVSSYFPHTGEEDCLRGWRGSGTIFFSMCNLRCTFCFHPNTLIATDAGARRIADLYDEAGDEISLGNGKARFPDSRMRVVLRNGTTARVDKVFRHHFSGELIRLKPYNCPPIHLTPNHKVFVVRKSEPDRVFRIEAGQLSKQHRLIVPKRKPDGRIIVISVRDWLEEEQKWFRKAYPGQAVEKLLPYFSQKITSKKLGELTGYHPAYIRKLRGQWKRGELDPTWEEFAPNDLLEEDDFVRFSTERRPGIPSNIELDEDLAWLLGIYCAEGHITSHKNRPNSHSLILSFGKTEHQLVKRASRLFRKIFKVKARVVEHRTTTTVEVGKSSLALLFKKLCGTGAKRKRVPVILHRATADVISAFMSGVFDGDGWENETHHVVNTISRRFAIGLFELGLFLDTMPSYHRWKPKPKKKIEGRTVNQSTLYYVKFPKHDPQTGKLRTRWTETEHGFLLAIHRMERIPYDGPVYNLEVDDPDHSYLAPFVAVSNCQNYDISQVKSGQETQPERLAEMMLELQAMGCHNINFVTPEHVVPQILEALPLAVEGGLRLPIVYNTSAYDSLDSLELLDGIVDIYMPDFKMWDDRLSLRYLIAKDYPEAARRVVKEMHRQVGPLKLDEQGLAKRGVLVRHLVMPGPIADTDKIMRFLADEVSRDTYVNVMAQYYPAGRVSDTKFEEINRRITTKEFADAMQAAHDAGLWRIDERISRGPGLTWQAVASAKTVQ